MREIDTRNIAPGLHNNFSPPSLPSFLVFSSILSHFVKTNTTIYLSLSLILFIFIYFRFFVQIDTPEILFYYITSSFFFLFLFIIIIIKKEFYRERQRMMMSQPPYLSSSSSSSGSSGSPAVRVEKATSEFLMGPDWTINIDICDAINSNPWLAKDVVKAVKKRLQHKNPKVQLLALTLLETLVKNCGENVHSQIAERSILPEMIKIVKKRADMNVRDKVLVLLDSWQEAFGGRGGKYPQYYYAYEELRHSGVEFPRRSPDSAPIFTPPATQPTLRLTQTGYGMPSNSTTRLDEAMASEIENLSLSSIESMRNALDLLSDMLQEINLNDREAVKDEVIVDVAYRCRANQKKLMQMLTTTSDEELLCQGLELNDSLQLVLAKHDAIASGSPLPAEVRSSMSRPSDFRDSISEQTEVAEAVSRTTVVPPPQDVTTLKDKTSEADEEEEDDFALLARRHSKTRSTVSTESVTSDDTAALDSSFSMALTLTDPPPPFRTTNDQDMIDFLSLALSTNPTSETPQAQPTASAHSFDTSPHNPQAQPTASTYSFGPSETPMSTNVPSYPNPTQPYPQSQTQVPFNSYVAPWAQPQPQQQPQPRSHYPPPPWAATPGYYNNPYSAATTSNTYSTPETASYMPSQGTRNLQHVNSFPAGQSNGMAVKGEPRLSSIPTNNAPAGTGQKPFIPSYRLFEDLNVLGNGDGRSRTGKTSSPMLPETSGQSMMGWKK